MSMMTWMIPLIILGIYGGLILMVVRWQQTVPLSLRSLINRLVRLERITRQLAALMSLYSVADPAPYGPLIEIFSPRLLNLVAQNKQLRQEYVEIQAEANRFSLNSWHIIIGSLYYWYPWYQINQKARRLTHQIGKLEQTQAEFLSDSKALINASWEVALLAREVSQRQQHLAGRIKQLTADHFSGAAFLEAIERLRKSEKSLMELPEILFKAEQAQVHAKVTKDQVVAAHQKLANLASEHKWLITHLDRWDADFLRAHQAISALQTRLIKLKGALISLPEAVNLEELLNRAKGIEQDASDLEARLAHPDVEQLASIAKQAQQFADEILGMLSLYTQTRKKQAEFDELVGDIQSNQETLSLMVAELKKSTEFPVKWSVRTQRLTEISSQFNRILNPGSARTPEELNQVRVELEYLYKQQFQLQRELHALADQHAAAVALYKELEIPDLYQWSERILPLAQQALSFGVQNFPRQLRISSFEADVHAFQTRIKDLSPQDIHQSVSESEITLLKANLDRISKAAALLHEQARSIQEYVRELQEKLLRANQTWQVLNSVRHQIRWLLNSNPVLKNAAEREFSILDRKLDQSKQALSIPDQGMIETKLAQLIEIEESIVSQIDIWLDVIVKDIQSRRNLISTRLEELAGIAQLNDPVLDRIQNLMLKTGIQISHDGGLEVEAIIPELKRKSDIWQEWTAVGQEFNDLIYAPLMDAFGNADRERQAIRQVFSLAKQVIPDGISWPPTTISLTEDRSTLEGLEKRWQTIMSEPVRAIWAVRRYTDLAADFRALHRQIQQKLEFAQQEQERITSLERDISNRARELRQRFRVEVSPEAIAGREEVSRVLARLEDLRTNWENKTSPTPKLSYDQLYEELFQLKGLLRAESE